MVRTQPASTSQSSHHQFRLRHRTHSRSATRIVHVGMKNPTTATSVCARSCSSFIAVEVVGKTSKPLWCEFVEENEKRTTRCWS